MKIDHIGIAVKSIEKSKKFYEDLGLTVEKIEEVEEQGVKVAFFNISQSKIELLETTKEGSISRFIEKRGEGIHHIAIEVEDIEKKVDELLSKGYEMVDKTIKIGAEGKKIAFVHPKSSSGVLIELTEKG